MPPIINSQNQRPLIMGILNVTPDSFSDGGQYNQLNQAIDRTREMLEQGADIIDIGGESTRPGAESISANEQISRVVPVIEGIRNQISKKIIISVDTTNYQVALAALEAGANWINDISAGEDAQIIDNNLDSSSDNSIEPMLKLAAKKQIPIVLMHRQGKSSTMQNAPYYQDVSREVKSYLKERASLALKMGVKKDNIIIDPGIGFGKLLQHNLALLADLKSLVALGFPVLLGTSRKSFIADICNNLSSINNFNKHDNNNNKPEQRVAGTCATTALAVNQGVMIFRVHDVAENRQAADIAWAIKNKL